MFKLSETIDTVQTKIFLSFQGLFKYVKFMNELNKSFK